MIEGYYQSAFGKAKSSVEDELSGEYKRIGVVEDALKYTRLGNRLIGLARSGKGASDPDYQKAERELKEHIHSNLRAISTNVLGGGYFLFRAISRAKNFEEQ